MKKQNQNTKKQKVLFIDRGSTHDGIYEALTQYQDLDIERYNFEAHNDETIGKAIELINQSVQEGTKVVIDESTRFELSNKITKSHGNMEKSEGVLGFYFSYYEYKTEKGEIKIYDMDQFYNHRLKEEDTQPFPYQTINFCLNQILEDEKLQKNDLQLIIDDFSISDHRGDIPSTKKLRYNSDKIFENDKICLEELTKSKSKLKLINNHLNEIQEQFSKEEYQIKTLGAYEGLFSEDFLTNLNNFARKKLNWNQGAIKWFMRHHGAFFYKGNQESSFDKMHENMIGSEGKKTILITEPHNYNFLPEYDEENKKVHEEIKSHGPGLNKEQLELEQFSERFKIIKELNKNENYQNQAIENMQEIGYTVELDRYNRGFNLTKLYKTSICEEEFAFKGKIKNQNLVDFIRIKSDILGRVTESLYQEIKK